MDSLSNACQSVRALRYRLIKLEALPPDSGGEATSVATNSDVAGLSATRKGCEGRRA